MGCAAARLGSGTALGLGLLVAVGAASCGRTGPGLDGFPAARREEPVGPRPGVDAGARLDAGPPDAPGCMPVEETCNAVDDDCDGLVDEVPAIGCPGGGSRYCVGGRFSACPRRCDVCMPGSQRVCFVNYCTYWATQRCSSDGMSMGPCVEREAPPECIEIARATHDSPELEQCCIDNGHCCRDEHDLDGDGDRSESLGACDGVTCAAD
jgi:hypothetical protein